MKTTILRRLKIIGIVLISLLLLYVMCDIIILPIYTRHGQEITVPDVTNISFAEAHHILKSQNFRIIKAGEQNSPAPPGYVIFQNPAANSKVKRGRRIYVILSVGERMVLMPKLVGQSERNAELTISRLGLVLNEIKYDYSTRHPKDVVIEQSIRENERLREGTEVSLVVSLGLVPEKFIMPNVIGKDLQEAQKAILKAGLSVGTITYQATDELLPDTVIEQSLKPNTETIQGQTIDLIVSELPPLDEE